MAIRSAIPGLVVARFNHVAGGVPWLFTIHGVTVGGSANNGTGMLSLANALDSRYSAVCAALLNNGNQYTGVSVSDLGPSLQPDATVTNAVTGTRGTDLTPQESCATVTLRTAFIGRAFRGRVYISGGCSSDLDNGGTDWGAGYATDCENAVAQCTAGFGDATPVYKAVVYHRAAGQGGSPAADSTTDIGAIVGRTELAMQKRRRS